MSDNDTSDDSSWGATDKAEVAVLCIVIVGAVIALISSIIGISRRRARLRALREDTERNRNNMELESNQREMDERFIASVLPQPGAAAAPYGRNPFVRTESTSTLPLYSNDAPPEYAPEPTYKSPFVSVRPGPS